jgi:hypothetical protein
MGYALCVIVVAILPYLDVFVYLIARGRDMQEQATPDAQREDADFRQHCADFYRVEQQRHGRRGLAGVRPP